MAPPPPVVVGGGLFGDVAHRLGAYVQWARNAADATILQEIQRLNGVAPLWQALPSGNRNYLQQTLDHPDAGHIRGARNHLARAWPHQVGYLYFATGAEARDARSQLLESYGIVAGNQREMEGLSTDEVWQLAEEALRNPEVVRCVFEARNQESNRRTLQMMIDKHRRLQGAEAARYAEEKRGSLVNILTKVIIPQLAGQIAKETDG